MSDSKDKSTGSPSDGAVPKAVVSRLSLYLRELQHLIHEGHPTTSSSQLGGRLGFTDAQVRKDLAYFGHFGYPGIGYRCDELMAAIESVTADPALHTRDLGGQATTAQVTAAVCARLQGNPLARRAA